MKKEIFKLKEYEYMGYELAPYAPDNHFGFKCEHCHARDMRRGCKFSFCPAGHFFYLVKKNESQILHLVLKKQWYNLIESGVKTEEYREIKKYWWQRLTSKALKYVVFSYGYTQRKMTFEIEKIKIGTGKAEWGAEPENEYFVIKLGERVK